LAWRPLIFLGLFWIGPMTFFRTNLTRLFWNGSLECCFEPSQWAYFKMVQWLVSNQPDDLMARHLEVNGQRFGLFHWGIFLIFIVICIKLQWSKVCQTPYINIVVMKPNHNSPSSNNVNGLMLEAIKDYFRTLKHLFQISSV
jgi:hypothetical protein